jgi:quinol monooxygenase YgiN
MHVAIRQYHVNPRSVLEITEQVEEGFIPLLRQTPGFIEYYWLNAGNGRVVSVGIFEDQASAEESTRLAADYVRQHLYELVRNPPEVIEGEVLLHES